MGCPKNPKCLSMSLLVTNLFSLLGNHPGLVYLDILGVEVVGSK